MLNIATLVDTRCSDTGGLALANAVSGLPSAEWTHCRFRSSRDHRPLCDLGRVPVFLDTPTERRSSTSPSGWPIAASRFAVYDKQQ